MKFHGWQGHRNFGETPRQIQLHAFRLLVRTAQGLACALALSGITAFSTPAADSMPLFEVRVINLADAAPATIARAEGEAGRILHDAGLKVVWLNCPREQGVGNRNPEDPCQQPFGPANVFVRVLSGQTRKGLQEDVFGFAIHPGLASVYYETAIDLAKAYRAEGMDVPTVLAGAMAHEIGHLLLGFNSHSPTGIMQAHWGRKQLQELLKRHLEFTEEQSRLIRKEWQTRAMLEVGRTYAPSSMS